MDRTAGVSSVTWPNSSYSMPLRDTAVIRVHHEPGRAQVVGEKAVPGIRSAIAYRATVPDTLSGITG